MESGIIIAKKSLYDVHRISKVTFTYDEISLPFRFLGSHIRDSNQTMSYVSPVCVMILS